jgi:hypothetical protein
VFRKPGSVVLRPIIPGPKSGGLAWFDLVPLPVFRGAGLLLAFIIAYRPPTRSHYSMPVGRIIGIGRPGLISLRFVVKDEGIKGRTAADFAGQGFCGFVVVVAFFAWFFLFARPAIAITWGRSWGGE